MNGYQMYPTTYGQPQYPQYPYNMQSLQTTCTTDQWSVPVLGCQKKTYVIAGGVGVVALLYLMTKG